MGCDSPSGKEEVHRGQLRTQPCFSSLGEPEDSAPCCVAISAPRLTLTKDRSQLGPWECSDGQVQPHPETSGPRLRVKASLWQQQLQQKSGHHPRAEEGRAGWGMARGGMSPLLLAC